MEIERSYNKLERARSLVQVAGEVVKLWQAGGRLAQNELSQGVILVSVQKSYGRKLQAQADF